MKDIKAKMMASIAETIADYAKGISRSLQHPDAPYADSVADNLMEIRMLADLIEGLEDGSIAVTDDKVDGFYEDALC